MRRGWRPTFSAMGVRNETCYHRFTKKSLVLMCPLLQVPLALPWAAQPEAPTSVSSTNPRGLTAGSPPFSLGPTFCYTSFPMAEVMLLPGHPTRTTTQLPEELSTLSFLDCLKEHWAPLCPALNSCSPCCHRDTDSMQAGPVWCSAAWRCPCPASSVPLSSCSGPVQTTREMAQGPLQPLCPTLVELPLTKGGLGHIDSCFLLSFSGPLF